MHMHSKMDSTSKAFSSNLYIPPDFCGLPETAILAYKGKEVKIYICGCYGSYRTYKYISVTRVMVTITAALRHFLLPKSSESVAAF